MKALDSEDCVSLKEQVVLITGGTRGIGKFLAQQMADAGFRVALTGRSAEEAESVALSIGDTSRVLGLSLEVTDQKAVEACVDQVERTLGPINLLINNAGFLISETLPWEVDADAWWKVMEVNIKGVWLCTRTVIGRMVQRGQGRIINMGSDTAIKPFPTLSAYSTSKAALLRLTDSFAVPAAAHGVAIFAVSPGMVKTDMTALLPNVAELPDEAWTPIEKISELCLFLATGKADALSGRYFHVNRDAIADCVARTQDILEQDANALRLKMES